MLTIVDLLNLNTLHRLGVGLDFFILLGLFSLIAFLAKSRLVLFRLRGERGGVVFCLAGRLFHKTYKHDFNEAYEGQKVSLIFDE